MVKIVIPYTPRAHWAGKDGIHAQLDKHRFSVLCAHRRFGKTLGMINQLIKRALLFSRNDGRFAYIAPYRKQAKTIAWDYLKRYTATIPGVKYNETDLVVELPNGSRIQVFGADNADALRGLYFDGIVVDEIGDIKPEVWGSVIRPALADRNGWCIFIGTPKGQNIFFELYQRALARDDWFAGMYRADETGVLPEEELRALQEELSENQYRQEMLCDFTAATDDALILLDRVLEAQKRAYKVESISYAPKILALDVARFGGDSSVLIKRQGLVAYEPEVFRKLDTMQLAAKTAERIDVERPDAVFIDNGAMGAGVVDRLRQLGFSIIEINFGSASMDPKYLNKRAEMWGTMADWLKNGQLPSNQKLMQELTVPTYSFDAANRLKLESKEKIRERTGWSPDIADALALTFAMPVFKQSDYQARSLPPLQEAYNPLDYM